MNLDRGASAASNNDPSLNPASTELSGIKEAGAKKIHSLNMFTISFFCLSSVPNICLALGGPAIEIFIEVIRERKLPWVGEG